jgi:hypothetical protein
VDGSVTEVSGDRVVVELSEDTTVSEGARGQVFTTTSLGGGDEQQIVAGVLRVEVVTGSIIVARLVDRSQVVDVGTGQSVSFSAGAAGAAQGILSIRATPSALVSLVDGTASPRRLGTTPVRDSVAPGRYRVQFAKEGYETVEQTVQVQSGETHSLRASLKATTGTLVVRPQPDDASVWVDGDSVGTGDVETSLETGAHEVTIEASGYTAETRTVQITPASTRSISPTLDRERGTLKVSTTPSSATVLLDGQEAGTTPLTTEVSTGPHTVTVQKQGYKSTTDTVSVRDDAPQEVTVDLKLPLNVALAGAKGPVENVKMRRFQRQIIVEYGISGNKDEYEVELQLSTDGGNSFEPLQSETMTGDVGEVTPGGRKRIRWSAFQLYPDGIYGDAYQLRLSAESSAYPGGFTVEVQSMPGGFTEFGGGRVGWATKEGFFGASYTQLGGDLTVISARAMPHWTLGWLKYRMILGAAYIDGPYLPSALQGGLELGSGLYIGRSFYVGGDALYLQTLAGEGEVGIILTIGVSL